MIETAKHRRALALDALVGLVTGDAVGNQAFRRHRVIAPGFDETTWAWTDDTQMACSVLDVLLRRGTVDQDELATLFAERVERCRDYGMGALHFLDDVRQGAPWRQASRELFRGQGSWGNGGAMRVTPVGAYFADDLHRAAAESAASAEVTHSHPEGIAGGVAAGVAAARAAALRGQPVETPTTELLDAALFHVPSGQVADGLHRALELLAEPAERVAGELGNGSRISAPDTVPFALWVASTRFNDFVAAIRACVAADGDMDTTAAIVGGILGAHHGADCVPSAWSSAREPLPSWLPTP